ncbi:MAG: hypothetical protein J7647_21610 [Cyanobacteria bacterium SBLK]|nr:hypothetical protein [Cyanobacteria bacterium SBLK]
MLVSDTIQQISLYTFYLSLFACVGWGIYQGWQLRNKALWGAMMLYILAQIAIHSSSLALNMLGGIMFALTLGLIVGYFPHGLFYLWGGERIRRNLR